ncbi:hypothetical protein DXA38_08205 [[Clostridium] innocuum]|uniref:Uncharacterized protein n=1 Tax=Clostridium innocuum TaxID=1522 RepID=A0A3E2VY32_CLOIN|nr:hypothetical protein DXA38_08205 [[Clostridium] innocuum]RHV66952.1 hypothetical protein DXB22_05685 [Clostridiaceae bacterium OM02-2AC]
MLIAVVKSPVVFYWQGFFYRQGDACNRNATQRCASACEKLWKITDGFAMMYLTNHKEAGL